jgi:hypothetical protein
MSEARFAPAALGLCTLAAQALGWRPAEFWAATPAELTAALGLTTATAASGLDRALLEKLMEQDNER